jgi:hypothetical protein
MTGLWPEPDDGRDASLGAPHKCGIAFPAGGTCQADVRDGQLFDPRHWRLVPAALQRDVYQAWARGRGRGTEAHLQACAAAKAAVEQALLDQAAAPVRHRH